MPVDDIIILNTVILSLALLVAARLLSFWQLTRINDLGVVGLVFLFGYFGILSNNASILTGATIWFQLAVFSYNSVALLLILFYLNLHKNKFEKVILGISLTWYGLLTILISLWKSFPQPDKATVLFFFEMYHTRGDAHPMGAGLKIPYNGEETIIYSTSHQILGILFWIFATCFSIYQLYQMQVPENQRQETQRKIHVARRNLFLERLLQLIWIITLLPFYGTTPEIHVILSYFSILFLISYALIALTFLSYPETLVMSKDQFQATFGKITEAFRDRSLKHLDRLSYVSELIDIIENYNIKDLESKGVVIKDLEEPFGFYIAKSSLIRFSETYKGSLNTLLVANFIAAFSSFSDEIFTQKLEDIRIQRTRNGEFEVYVLVMGSLMFAYLYRGISLLVHSKLKDLSTVLVSDSKIREYLLAESAEQDTEMLDKIRIIVREILRI